MRDPGRLPNQGYYSIEFELFGLHYSSNAWRIRNPFRVSLKRVSSPIPSMAAWVYNTKKEKVIHSASQQSGSFLSNFNRLPGNCRLPTNLGEWKSSIRHLFAMPGCCPGSSSSLQPAGWLAGPFKTSEETSLD